jgi:hypothetical protein
MERRDENHRRLNELGPLFWIVWLGLHRGRCRNHCALLAGSRLSRTLIERGKDMDIGEFVNLVDPYMRRVGQVVEELKRQDIARIDIALLNRKRQVLDEQREEFLSRAKAEAGKDTAKIDEEMTDRGLMTSTVRHSRHIAVENQWADQILKGLREYNRAIEEIALMEQRIREEFRPWWKRLFRLG